MEPHHHHEHSHRLTSLNKAFIIGIALNITFVIVEFGVGFYYNSLGLLSDAGHNLGDVASLVLAMLAFRLEKVHPNSRYTYGYKKSTILVSLLNAVASVAVSYFSFSSPNSVKTFIEESMYPDNIGVFVNMPFFKLDSPKIGKLNTGKDKIYKAIKIQI